MSIRVVTIIAEAAQMDTLRAIADQHNAIDFWSGSADAAGRQTLSILIGAGEHQALLDAIQKTLGKSGKWRVIILPVEGMILSEQGIDKSDIALNPSSKFVSREELFYEISKGAQPDANFALLTLLSTIVAAIGLIEDSVAVVIGAMVIAPLLGPHLALALGSALGDRSLMLRALRTSAVGVPITLLSSLAIGWVLPIDIGSRELISRTIVGFDSIALALASGAAAALSLTTGFSATLVGVMVAVAMLPPAVVVGLMLGEGQFGLAYSASLLLAVNIVCVNLSAQIVLIVKGVKPRTWFEKKSAQQSTKLNLMIWIGSLVVLGIAIYLRGA